MQIERPVGSHNNAPRIGSPTTLSRLIYLSGSPACNAVPRLQRYTQSAAADGQVGGFGKRPEGTPAATRAGMAF